MTKCDVYLQKYRWSVTCFIGYEPEDAVFLCQQLASIGCSNDALREAFEHLTQGSDERGLTYSNVKDRRSIVAIGLSTTHADMVNTVSHELFHVVAHICEKDGIDMLSEEPCYIMGSLCEEFFIFIRTNNETVYDRH